MPTSRAQGIMLLATGLFVASLAGMIVLKAIGGSVAGVESDRMGASLSDAYNSGTVEREAHSGPAYDENTTLYYGAQTSGVPSGSRFSTPADTDAPTVYRNESVPANFGYYHPDTPYYSSQ